MDGLVVRPTTRRDLAVLDALFSRSYPRLLKDDYPPSVLVTALPLISRAQPALLASGTFYLAERDGQAVGAGGWTPRRDRAIADIRHVVTDPDHTRQGVGRAIFARVFKEAAEAGVRLLDCRSTRTAVPFYEALGFRHLGPIEVELRPGILFPAIRMERRL